MSTDKQIEKALKYSVINKGLFGYAYIYNFNNEVMDIALIKEDNIHGKGHCVTIVHRLPYEAIHITDRLIKHNLDNIDIRNIFHIQYSNNWNFSEDTTIYNIDRLMLRFIGFEHEGNNQFSFGVGIPGAIINAYYDRFGYTETNKKAISGNSPRTVTLLIDPKDEIYGYKPGYTGMVRLHSHDPEKFKWVKYNPEDLTYIAEGNGVTAIDRFRQEYSYFLNSNKKYRTNRGITQQELYIAEQYEEQAKREQLIKAENERLAKLKEAEELRAREEAAKREKEEQLRRQAEQIRGQEEAQRKLAIAKNIQYKAIIYGKEYNSFSEIAKKFRLNSGSEQLFTPYGLDAELALTLSRKGITNGVKLSRMGVNGEALYKVRHPMLRNLDTNGEYSAKNLISILEPGLKDVYERNCCGRYNPIIMSVNSIELCKAGTLVDGVSAPFKAFNKEYKTWYDACIELNINTIKPWDMGKYSHWDSELLLCMIEYNLEPDKDIKLEFLGLNKIVYYTIKDSDELKTAKELISIIDTNNTFKSKLHRLKTGYNPARRFNDAK